jgi:NitT/TauT family transport system substrate-binding protein
MGDSEGRSALRTKLQWWAPTVLLALSLISAAHAQAPEQRSVTIAVGGKAALYYLPLTLAERLGYFKDAGLEVQILDFAGGAKALQAMMGGSADVVSGGYDHVIVLRARGQKLKSFVLQVATPSLALGVAKGRAASYKSPKDLKGLKVGVTAPGSSTHIFLNYLLDSVGLTPDDVSVIGVGTGPTAVAALKAGQIDAIVNVEPAITLLERNGSIVVVTETMSEKGARAVFGEPLPAGSFYTREDFLKRNPNTAQALANAMVRALRWLEKASPEQILRTVPPEYALGDRETYLAALARQRQGYSRNGLIPPAGAAANFKVLLKFDAAVQAAPDLDIAQTYDNRFVEKALATLR